MNVQELMDRAKDKQRIASDFALSKVLGVSQTAVWSWRKGTSYPKPNHTLQLAELAGVNAGETVLEIMHQAEKDPELKKVFQKLQRRVISAALLIGASMQCILCSIHENQLFARLRVIRA